MALSAQERLVAAAMKLFAENGYDATSTRDIVAEAQVNISLIAYHFGGKEGLLKVCLEKAAEEVFGKASKKLGHPASAAAVRTSLEEFAQEFLAAHAEHPHAHRLVIHEMERESVAFREILQSHYVGYMETLADFFAQAQKNKVIKSKGRPVTLAIAFHGALAHQVRLDRFRSELGKGSYREAAMRKEIGRDIVATFCDGLLAS